MDTMIILIATHVLAFFVGGLCAWLAMCIAAYGQD